MEAVARLPGVHLGVVTEDDEYSFPASLRQSISHWRVQDSLDADQLAWATAGLARQHGSVHRILAVNEQIQLPVALVRERLGIEGMGYETMANFRDKARMKNRFREAGVPCSHHCGATSPAEAWEFVEKVGFPVCVKPVDGAAAQATFRVDEPEVLDQILKASEPRPERALQIEEFVVGNEHSFETLSLNGSSLWHSLTHYDPTPLNVVANPWIQWKIVLPREIDDSGYDDIRQVAHQALTSLGMDTGLTHLEWFRRADGSLAVGEVAARPPGAQIVTLINRANDCDMYDMWARLMVLSEFRPNVERRYATGIAFLRGLGGARVRGLEGVEALNDLGDMVTDHQLPTPGQMAGTTYEGEGFVVVRHPETSKVEAALNHIISNIRVQLI